MKYQALNSFLFSLYLITVVKSKIIAEEVIRSVNNEPIIGILSQEIDRRLEKSYPNEYKSYIAASYVKFVEGAGARVVPIWIGKNDSYYEDIMSKLNGVLFPGGETNLNAPNGYGAAGEQIYKIAKKLNDNGDYFPILGTCLGFELIIHLAANRVKHASRCSAREIALPLIFTPEYKQSQLFKNAPENVIRILQSENITANLHSFCVTKANFTKVNLTNQLRIMSLSHDKFGLEFISTIEHLKYPFYGLQFHPEKNDYEWIEGQNIPHGKNPTIIDQYFGNFFVNEARKSLHKFEDKMEESMTLIYNYPTTYTGLKGFDSIQCYLFS